MKKIKFVDPETFVESEQEFEDFHFNLAERIGGYLKMKYETTLKEAVVVTSSPMSDKEGKKLIVGLVKNREKGAENAEKYRITIEKLEE